ncbi:MAG: WD40 repeat domain-containing protein [Clostridiaceae bacterium]|nr:WD40 repeat domain-containing protein [Clostridiaceae bacterium]
MAGKQDRLFSAQVHRMCFDQDYIYTSVARNITKWDKKTKERVSSFDVPPNDNLRKGALLCTDEHNIYFNSIYFFHVMDKKTNEMIYQKRFGTDNSSDFDLGNILVDEKQVYFPMRNRGLVVVDKNDYENVRYLNKDKGSVWALDHDESTVYFGGVDYNIYAFDKSTLTLASVFSGHKGNIHFIYSFKEYIVSVSADNSIIVWNKSSGSILHQLRKAGCSLGRAIMTDKYVVCVAKNTIRIWETGTWSLIAESGAFGTMFFDDGFIYLADRNVPRVAVLTVEDIIREGRIM